MPPENYQSVEFTAPGQAELIDHPWPAEPLGPTQVQGRTLATLVSAGTELAVYQGLFKSISFPCTTGYAAVAEVTLVGKDVTDVKRGDRIFCMNPHQCLVRAERSEVVLVPDGLAPETAIFARLMGVTQAAQVTVAANPPAKVVITGLGLVGNLGAQVFAAAGYDVIACDPSPKARDLAESVGVPRVLATVPVEDPGVVGEVAIGLDCSGHEQAVLDLCRVIRPQGEVVLTGVPWRQQTDLLAHEILHEVFFRYVVLRSGWEWQVPTHSDDGGPSLFNNYAQGLQWLAEGKIRTEGLAQRRDPDNPQGVYDDLLAGKCSGLSYWFDWQSQNI